MYVFGAQLKNVLLTILIKFPFHFITQSESILLKCTFIHKKIIGIKKGSDSESISH